MKKDKTYEQFKVGENTRIIVRNHGVIVADIFIWSGYAEARHSDWLEVKVSQKKQGGRFSKII